MSSQDNHYDDQLMDALLQEQACSDRAQAIHEVENAIMADVVSHVAHQPAVDWRRLAVSMSIAAGVVLGLGISLSYFLRPTGDDIQAQSEGRYQYIKYIYLPSESGETASKSMPMAKHMHRRPAAAGSSLLQIASMRNQGDGSEINIPSADFSKGWGKHSGTQPVNDGENPATQPDPAKQRYVMLIDQVWQDPFQNPLSAVSIDVDDASYQDIQKFVYEGKDVPRGSVRIEECINAFAYNYKAPKNGQAFGMSTNLIACPWNEDNVLLKIGVRGRGEASAESEIIAENVHMQLEFNPQRVMAYRLIGYADAISTEGDIQNDPADEIRAGHTMTAFYEIVPVGKTEIKPQSPGLKYQKPADLLLGAGPSDEWLTLKLHHQLPGAEKSSLLETVLKGKVTPLNRADDDTRFAAGVALFGMKLRGIEDVAEVPWDQVLGLARPGLKNDMDGKRADFIATVIALKSMSR